MEKKNTHIVYGLISGFIMVLIILVTHLAGGTFKHGTQYFAYLALTGVILNSIAFSKANDGYVTFGNVFGSCFKASMIITIIVVLWNVISIYVFPEMKDQAMAMAREEMAKNPKLTDEQIDMALNVTKKFWNPIVVASSIFVTLFWGTIFSLISAAFAKKKGPQPLVGDNF